MRPGPRTSSRGFSLIEVLAVVSLIALLVGMVGTSVYRSLDGVKVRQAGKDLVTALRYTRGQAIVAREEKTLEVNVEKKSFQAPERKVVELPEGVDVTLKTAAFDLERSVGRVRFFPDGSSTGAQITLTAGERSWLISVGWLTGEIALETQSGSG